MRYSLVFAPRAIDDLEKKDRIVYSIYDDLVVVNILQMTGHYDDK